MVDMNVVIKKELMRIEKENDIKILYACESGSRGWGFASKDSDYDVRFIYVRRARHYLKVPGLNAGEKKDNRDVVEEPIDDLLDISGWDLQKALFLMNKSNPTLFEWLRSPIVYRCDMSMLEFREMAKLFYSPLAMTHHYLHMADGNAREFMHGPTRKLKKYLYVLRAIAACMWVEKFNSIPPMDFLDTVSKLDMGPGMKDAIDNLIHKKIYGNVESMVIDPIDGVERFIDYQIRRIKRNMANLPPRDVCEKEMIDRFFVNNLMKAWRADKHAQTILKKAFESMIIQ